MEKISLDVTCAKKQRYSQEKLETFMNLLNTKDFSNIDDDLILIEFYKQSIQFLEENFENSSRKRRDRISNKKVKPTKKKLIDEEERPKLRSMKTAGDVRRRIQWDKLINREEITIGYLDRFVGIKECKFNEFDWDLVCADLDALAIPEHRINYFKYRDQIIWDKNIRLDNVYGSTGSNMTIYDVINSLKLER